MEHLDTFPPILNHLRYGPKLALSGCEEIPDGNLLETACVHRWDGPKGVLLRVFEGTHDLRNLSLPGWGGLGPNVTKLGRGSFTSH